MDSVSPEARPPVVGIVGPTASGKSALGVELARRMGGEIISADSMQLYRGMDVGTAKVTVSQRRGVLHHLLDIFEVTQEAAVKDYQERARAAVAEIRERGRTPLMVGGSGLYIRAVLDVIDFPPTDPELRGRLSARLEEYGADVLRAELAAVDPEAAAVVKDDRRLIRALEVVTLTGRTFSSYMPRRMHDPAMEPVIQLGLRVPRELLHRRIAARVEQMVRDGLPEEVQRLAESGLRGSPTAAQAIGYQQFLEVLDGRLNEAEAVQATVTATRKYARRQETWFRADPRIRWIDVQEGVGVSELADEAEHHIAGALRGKRRAAPGVETIEEIPATLETSEETAPGEEAP